MLKRFILPILLLVSQCSWSQHSFDRQKLDLYIQEFASNSASPGMSIVIVEDDRIVLNRGYGFAQSEEKTPMTSQTQSAIGSLTKSMTSLAIMQLVEKNILLLDDPVKTHIPEFRTANKDKSDKITVRMLLNNTSGLQGGVSSMHRDPEIAMELLLKNLESLYLTAEPGSTYEYSNAAFSIAGLLISRLSGKPYCEYMNDHVFSPLGMENTICDPHLLEKEGVLHGHHMGINRGIPAQTSFESGEMVAAGSSVYSNTADLANYMLALLNDGTFLNNAVIRTESIKQLWTPEITFPGLTDEMGGDGSDYRRCRPPGRQP